MDAKVRIVMEGPGYGKIYIDGKKIDYVVGVEFSTAVDEFNLVTIKICPPTVEIEGPAIVEIKEIEQ